MHDVAFQFSPITQRVLLPIALSLAISAKHDQCGFGGIKEGESRYPRFINYFQKYNNTNPQLAFVLEVIACAHVILHGAE